jgi:hypothetical protein
MNTIPEEEISQQQINPVKPHYSHHIPEYIKPVKFITVYKYFKLYNIEEKGSKLRKNSKLSHKDSKPDSKVFYLVKINSASKIVKRIPILMELGLFNHIYTIFSTESDGYAKIVLKDDTINLRMISESSLKFSEA